MYIAINGLRFLLRHAVLRHSRIVTPHSQWQNQRWLHTTSQQLQSTERSVDKNRTQSGSIEIPRRYLEAGFSTLDFESAQHHTNDPGSRLTDRKEFRNDFKLWNLLLDHQLAQNGVEGARTIWYGFRNRGEAVRFDDNVLASKDMRWKLLECAVSVGDVAWIKYLCSRDVSWMVHDDLYPRVIAMILKTDLNDAEQVQRAVRVGRWLYEVRGHDRPSFRLLLAELKPTTSSQVQKLLRIHCKSLAQYRSHYDSIMEDAWQQLSHEHALLVHRQLLSSDPQHLPRDIHAIEPLIKVLAETRTDPGPYLEGLKLSGASLSHQAKSLYDLFSSDNDSKSIKLYKDRGLSDGFVARAFATSLLSFQFVLNSLLVFGLKEIGPQALRVIGQADPDPKALTQKLKIIDDSSIDTGSSAYARLLRKLCTSNQTKLLEQLLRTDMHHDVFEDRDKQVQLLAESVDNGEWATANMLICTLNDGIVKKGARDPMTAAICHQLSFGRPITRSFLTQLERGQIVVKEDSARTSGHKKLLGVILSTIPKPLTISTQRRPSLVAGILQDLMLAGIPVPSSAWTRPLPALMRSASDDRISKTCLWLAEWYRPARLADMMLSRPLTDVERSLDYMFGQQFLAGVMYHALPPQIGPGDFSSHRRQFQYWLTLLALLQREFGLFSESYHLTSIRKRLVIQFRKLDYGAGGTHYEGRPIHSAREIKKYMELLLDDLHSELGGHVSEEWKLRDGENAFAMLGAKTTRKAWTTLEPRRRSVTITKDFATPDYSSDFPRRDRQTHAQSVVVVHTENVHSTLEI